MKKIIPFIYLHILLFIYSLGAICSKLAGEQAFLSFKFILFYGLVLANLFLYAIIWQQILKKMSLVTAYANKAITVVWGMLWGILLFKEKITVWNIIGAIIIIIGIVLVVTDDKH